MSMVVGGGEPGALVWHVSGQSASAGGGSPGQRAASRGAEPSTGRAGSDLTPPGAQVEIDGTQRGVTPYQRALLVGRHQVKLSLEGYSDYQQSVSVESGQSQTLAATLTQAAAGESSAQALTAKRPLWRYLVGGGLVASGVLISGFGISAISQHGSCADAADTPPGAPCNFLYDTRALGGGLLGVGLGLAIGGALTIAWPAKATPARTQSAPLR
jgi:hypothetical protein